MEKKPIRLDDDLRSLIAECREILDDIEPCLIGLGEKLENNEEPDDETVNLIFRGFHTIKGTAAFYQLNEVVAVAHKSETLLECFRNRKENITTSSTDLLCQACDVIESLLQGIEISGNSDGCDEKLTSILYRLGCRIDLHTGGLEDGSLTSGVPVEASVFSCRNTANRHDDAEAIPAKVGRNTRIFVAECRKLIKELEALDPAPGWTKNRVITARESMHVIKQGALFLGFDHLGHGVSGPLTMLDQLHERGRLPDADEQARLHTAAQHLIRLLDILDRSGGDQPTALLPPDDSGQRVQEDDDAALTDLNDPSHNPIDDQTASLKVVHPGGPETSGPWRFGERRQVERRDVRVNIEKLDELINLVGELVIAENMVVRNPDIQNLELENFDKASAHLRKIIQDLQDVALAVRMVPIAGVFRKMIRLVHDLSTKSGKKVNLTILGEDTEIDKTVAELIADPLVHLLRNAIDHGIMKKTDHSAGRVDGRIVLEARHDGGEVLVIVRDDGRGLDTEKILSKALALGIVDPDRTDLSRQDIYNLIFHPGFSTLETVTDLSGRGVGMDVVKQNMEKIKGHIHVFSKPGQGTTFVLGIPLTLAIIDGMLVRVGQTSFTIPLLSIRETIQIHTVKITTTMDAQEMIRLRDQLVPVIRLDRLYGLKRDRWETGRDLIVVVEYQGEIAGLLIDDIIGEQQTVIKGLSGYMEHVTGISGCTILGDGQVSLILDVGGVIEKAQAYGQIPQTMAI